MNTPNEQFPDNGLQAEADAGNEHTHSDLTPQEKLIEATEYLHFLHDNGKIGETVGKTISILPFGMTVHDKGTDVGVWQLTTPELTARIWENPNGKLEGYETVYTATVVEKSKSGQPQLATDDQMQKIADIIYLAHSQWDRTDASNPVVQKRTQKLASKIGRFMHRKAYED